MSDQLNVTILCTNTDKVACNAYADTLGCGPATCSVPLSTSPGVTNPALATHWGGSGWNPTEAVDAMQRSLDPKFFVLPNEGSSFDANIANVTMDGQVVALYRINEPI